MHRLILAVVLFFVSSTLSFAEAPTETKEESKPSIQAAMENAFIQQGQKSWMQWGAQGVDAAQAANGTWQVDYQIQTVMGTVPQSATETWRWDARQKIFYDGAGWMWKGKTAGNLLQVKTKLVSGANAMLTIEFISNNEAVGSINVSGTATLSPCMGQFRAVRAQ